MDNASEGQELQKCNGDNHPTENDDVAMMRPSEIQSAVPAASVEGAQLTTTTTLDAAREEKDGKEESLRLDEAVTLGTSTLPPPEEFTQSIQDRVEVAKTEPPSGPSALLMLNVPLTEGGSSTSNSATCNGGDSMEVDDIQSQEEDPSATNPNEPPSAEIQVLGSSSINKMKNEEGRSTSEKTVGKTDEEHSNGESHKIEISPVASAGGKTTMVMEMPPKGPIAATTITYEGEVGSS